MENHAHHFSLFLEPLEHGLEPLLLRWGLSEPWTEALVHTLGDFLDISVLVLLVVSLVSYLQTFIPYDKMRQKLASLHGWLGCALALVLGFLSPFCSCSIIPILMGFLAAGVPLVYCLVFLTTASCLNLTALTSVFAAFPLSFALTYLGCAAAVSVGGAYLVSAFGGTSLVRMDKLRVEHDHHHHGEKKLSRVRTALCAAGRVYKNVWPFMLLGVVASVLLNVFVSDALIDRLLMGNVFALPLAALIGGALHSDVFSILPIAQTLFAHSFSVALTFLLATMLFSVAEWALLSQAFRGKLIARYAAVLVGFAFVCGLVVRLVLGA